MSNTTTNNVTYANDLELLYRRILSNKCNDKTPDHYIVSKPSGEVRITKYAFMGGKKPSVYRAHLIEFNPKIVKDECSNGIISLQTKSVKTIKFGEYTVNVKIAPEDDNPTNPEIDHAHAEIVFVPKLIPKEGVLSKTKIRNMRSRLRDALARKATCVIKPNPLE